MGSDRPLDIIKGNASYFYHRDALSTTTTITNITGNLAASYQYDAYGNLKQSADTIGNPLQFVGAPWDATTGLVDDRARFYDPSTGAFLTPDPMGGSYAYAGDNPVNRVDPSGKFNYAIEGGDGGQGCTMALYLSGGCVFQKDQPREHFSWGRCAPDLALFGITTFAGLIGVYLPEGDAALLAERLITIDTYVADFAGLAKDFYSYYTGRTDLGGTTWSIIQLLWDFGVDLVKRIFEAIGNDLFATIAAVLSLGSDIVPGVVEAKLLVWGPGTVIGVAGLAVDSCLPGQ